MGEESCDEISDSGPGSTGVASTRVPWGVLRVSRIFQHVSPGWSCELWENHVKICENGIPQNPWVNHGEWWLSMSRWKLEVGSRAAISSCASAASGSYPGNINPSVHTRFSRRFTSNSKFGPRNGECRAMYREDQIRSDKPKSNLDFGVPYV
jgi:hypothetical protein